MYARCPSCRTFFDVDDETLSVRAGMVRCGICHVAFNASWNLVDQLPEVALPSSARGSPQQNFVPVPDHAATDVPGVDEPQHEPPPPSQFAEEATVLPNDETLGGAAREPEIEVVRGEIELDSESILAEVERLDQAFQEKQEQNRERAADGEGLESSPEAQSAFDIVPDDEIVLETLPNPWQGPDVDAENRRGDARPDRVATSVDRMRGMLDPVEESAPSTEQPETASGRPPQFPSPPQSGRTELPAEIDPYRTKMPMALDAGPAQQVFERTYESSDADASMTDRDTTVAALWAMVWFVGLMLLLAAAIWQIRTFYLFDFAQNATLRPLLSGFCRVAMCQVPPRRDSRLIDLVGTNVETHPAAPGALRVTVSLINRAGFAQAPPSLEVSLSDKLGRVVGRRTYLPSDYSPSAEEPVLEPNVMKNVTLDLAAPSESAVGYEIQLIPD